MVSEFNSISSCAILFLDLMWCFCVCILHIYIYIYVTSNAGFQIYRITIIHIHISTISNIFYLQDFDRFMKGYWSQKTFPPLPSRLLCALFFPNPHGYMATTKRIWKKVYSICNLCNQFHWKHIMAIYLQMLRYYLEYWCRRYKDTHKVIFTKTIINKYVFFGTAVHSSCYILCAFCATIFCYVCIYIYMNMSIPIYIYKSEFNSISSCAILFLDLMWCFCVCILHIYIYIYVTSNAGFQIYRITIIHIHISTISNIYSICKILIALWKGIDHKRLSLHSFPDLVSSFFPKPPMATWLQQNASGRKYIPSVTYATNFIENA